MQSTRLVRSLLGINKLSNPNGNNLARLCGTPYRGDHQFKKAFPLSLCSVHSPAAVKYSSHYCQQFNQNASTPFQKSFSTTSTTFTSKTLSEQEIKRSVDNLTDQFMEARELLEDARQSLGSIYFSEDMQDAQTAITDTLKLYENLLKQLTPEQKQDVLRTIGLKMEELKAQEQALKDESLS